MNFKSCLGALVWNSDPQDICLKNVPRNVSEQNNAAPFKRQMPKFLCLSISEFRNFGIKLVCRMVQHIFCRKDFSAFFCKCPVGPQTVLPRAPLFKIHASIKSPKTCVFRWRCPCSPGSPGSCKGGRSGQLVRKDAFCIWRGCDRAAFPARHRREFLRCPR